MSAAHDNVRVALAVVDNIEQRCGRKSYAGMRQGQRQQSLQARVLFLVVFLRHKLHDIGAVDVDRRKVERELALENFLHEDGKGSGMHVQCEAALTAAAHNTLVIWQG